MPHKEKLKVQEKIELIQRCQTGNWENGGQPDSGVDLKTIYHWLCEVRVRG